MLNPHNPAVNRLNPHNPFAPCPKCGEPDVLVEFHHIHYEGPKCFGAGLLEHLRRKCPKCGYWWVEATIEQRVPFAPPLPTEPGPMMPGHRMTTTEAQEFESAKKRVMDLERALAEKAPKEKGMTPSEFFDLDKRLQKKPRKKLDRKPKRKYTRRVKALTAPIPAAPETVQVPPPPSPAEPPKPVDAGRAANLLRQKGAKAP